MDKDYFTSLECLKNEYGRDLVYSSFSTIYTGVCGDWTRKDRERCYLLCEKTSKDYNKPTLLLWITLYMTMLAEEKKENTILGKKIKRLGVYNLLYDEYPVDYIVKYMRNMRWYKLKELMIERGIYYDK